ncbi:MAG: 5-formyltetrahydrofolate cyclo-ligase [Verrucomicrobiae bacterium]|nr:5-formyltetrahydrofolate cyclo-ligase [Verrucomicrobiae bacterium]
MLARRAALSMAEVEAASRAVEERVWQLPQLKAPGLVCCYVSAQNEVGTHRLIRELLRRGWVVSVPVFRGDRYALGRIRDFDVDLRVGHAGLLEPREWEPVGDPAVWLVPGVAFDRHGHRLGRGKGYFDRLLNGSAGFRIALAYEFQVLPQLPVASHDEPIDVIVTPSETIWIHGGKQ